MKGFKLVPVFIVIVAMSTSCSPTVKQDVDKPPYAYYSNSDPGGDMSNLSGRLSLIEGCLIIESNSAKEKYIPVFPGEDVDFSEGTLTLPDGSSVRPGEDVKLTGGVSTSDQIYLPAACPKDVQLFFVAN